jgi:hypothetical protein
LSKPIDRRHQSDKTVAAGIAKTLALCFDAAMSQPSTCSPLCRGYRFPPEIITWCVWLYYRFSLSLRDVSDVMLARGIEGLARSHPFLDAAIRHGCQLLGFDNNGRHCCLSAMVRD